MAEPNSKIAVAGGLFIKAMIFQKAGDANHGHSHTYDHHTLVGRGRVRVESNGKSIEIGELELIFIPRGVVHTIVALEDKTTVCCLHALHPKDDPGNIVDVSIIPPGTPEWSMALAVPLLSKDAGFVYPPV